LNLEDDDVDVANGNQQLLQKKVEIELSYPTYQRIKDYLNKKYPNSNLYYEDKLHEIDYLFSLGLEQAKKEFECPILFEERIPRKDRMEKLGKIALEFTLHPNYPKIKSLAIVNIINKILPLQDKRTIKKYLYCINQYIGKPKEFGECDVSGFVERMPDEFFKTSSSTSSFIEGSLDNEL